jgi:glycosyltransferase involved in cell wall biosynthesis
MLSPQGQSAVHKTITITATNRQKLFKAMLGSLASNNLEGWTIHIAIEPSSATSDMLDICHSVLAGLSHEISVNDEVLGVEVNPHRVLTRAFAAGADLNLFLEEDLLVSPDATAIAYWFGENHKPGWLCLNLLAATCGSAGTLSNPLWPNELFLARTFNSLGFAARREEWYGLIEPIWFGSSVSQVAGGWAANWGTKGGGGWDWSIYALLAHRTDLFSVQPVLARAVHMGETGTHASPEFHRKAFQGIDICRTTGNSYRLVDIRDLDRPVRSLAYAQEELTTLRLQLEKMARVTGGAMARLVGQRQAESHRADHAIAHLDFKPNQPRSSANRRQGGGSLVSVVLSVRDGAPYLGAAMRSILSQTETALDLIIIDDGSSDTGMNIARSFKDPRMRIIEDNAQLGLVERLNQALDSAPTQFVARMDADDISAPNRLERQLAFMTAHPEVGICGSWYMLFKFEGLEEARLPTGHFRIAARTLFDSPFGHSTVMFNMKHLDQHGLRYSKEAEHAEDYELWERAHPLVRMANIPEFLLYYRQHPEQVSLAKASEQRRVSDQVRGRALERFGISATPEQIALHCAYSAWESLDIEDRRERALSWLRRIRSLKGSWRASDRAIRRECRRREVELRKGLR